MLIDSPSSAPPETLPKVMPMQDTVGAVSWDAKGKLAAGVSRSAISLTYHCTHFVCSGGLLLKHPGRIGEVRTGYNFPVSIANANKAAVFGAGCWSQTDSDIGVACSVSGLVHHLCP